MTAFHWFFRIFYGFLEFYPGMCSGSRPRKKHRKPHRHFSMPCMSFLYDHTFLNAPTDKHSHGRKPL